MSEAKVDTVLSQGLLDAQVGVLGSMLLDDTVVGMVLSQVSPADFITKVYRTVFEAVQGLFRDGLPTDAISVRERLGGGVNGPWTETLTGIIEATPTSANAAGYVRLLKESSSLYRFRLLGDELSAAESLDDARKIVDRAMQLQVGRPEIHALTFTDGYERFFERHSGDTAVEFIHWPIVQMDEVVKAEPGDVMVLGAYPGDGKTAFALQCAAKFGGSRRIGYFSFESKAERLYDRHVARTALVSQKRIKANEMTEEDFREIIDLKKTITAPNVTIIDAAGMTAMDIVAYSQAKHFETIVVDYIQQVAAPSGYRMSEFDRVTAVSHELQSFAVRTGTSILELSQLSRPERVRVQYKDEDGTKRVKNVQPPPTMSNLRSSGQLEQDADIILLMWREDYDVKNSPRIIQVAKNRDGEAMDKVRCHFDGEHQTFSRIEPRRDPYNGWTPKKPPADAQTSFWADGPAWKEVKDEAATPFDDEKTS